MQGNSTTTKTDATIDIAKLGQRLELLTAQIESLSNGEGFDKACINPANPQELHIRLGEALGFIRRMVLSDGKLLFNMDYRRASPYTPSQIVALFKPFGARTGEASAACTARLRQTMTR